MFSCAKLLTITTIVTLSQYLFLLLLPFIVYENTQSYGLMNLVKVIEYLPNVTIALLIGSIVDQYGWRRNMIFSILIQGIMMFSLIIVITAKLNNYFFVLAVLYIIASMTILFNNARVSAFSFVIDRGNLYKANSSLQAIIQSSQIVAPALLVVLSLLSNLVYGLFFCALTLLVVSVYTLLIKCVGNDRSYSYANKVSLKSAFYFLKKQKALLNWSIVASIINAVEASQIILYIFYAKSVIKLSNFYLGVLFALVSFAVILFCILINKYKQFFFKSSTFVALFSLSAITYIACCIDGGIFLLTVSLLISNITFALTAIHIWTYRQLKTPKEMLGQVTGITSMIFKLGIPIIMLITYFLTSYVGSLANYLLFSALCLCVACIIFFKERRGESIGKV